METPVDEVLVGLVGAGIGPSLSPALHEGAAARLDLRYMYRRLDLERLGLGANDVPRLVRTAADLGFDGLNITHPGKQTVIAALDSLSADAAALNAVNTVVLRDGRLRGHNTDWSGFAGSLRHGLPDARLGHVVVLGAGGAGSAATYALARLGAERVTVVDADARRAADVQARLSTSFGAVRIEHADIDKLAVTLAEADGFVHATPTGMAGHPGLAVPTAALYPALWVADIVYRPLHTPLLAAARAAGCRTLDGGGMAVRQAADSFALFTGHEPDRELMQAHFDELVRAEVDDG